MTSHSERGNCAILSGSRRITADSVSYGRVVPHAPVIDRSRLEAIYSDMLGGKGITRAEFRCENSLCKRNGGHSRTSTLRSE